MPKFIALFADDHPRYAGHFVEVEAVTQREAIIHMDEAYGMAAWAGRFLPTRQHALAEGYEEWANGVV